MKAQVLVYRSELLAYSETFIAAQVAAMRRYAPFYVGLRRVSPSLPLAAPELLTGSDRLPDRARRYVFLKTGWSPGLLGRLRAREPALLHAHFALDAAEALPLARSLDLPLVVTLHGYDVMAGDEAHGLTRRGRLYLARRRRLWCEARLFLCVSEAIRQRAVQRGFPPDRLRVHAIGIDLQQYAVPEHRRPQPVVLFVGRLIEKKGCIHLLRAMRLVRDTMPGTRLVIVGEGPERARLEAEARLIVPETLFLGLQTAAQVRQWMAVSRVLAVPSITARDGDAEGLPTVVGEAMAMGLPVAAFRSSGIPELLRHGTEGLLSEPGDVAGLARDLLRLCQDEALAQDLSQAGRRRVQQCFEVSAQTALLETMYDEVLHAWSQAHSGAQAEGREAAHARRRSGGVAATSAAAAGSSCLTAPVGPHSAVPAGTKAIAGARVATPRSAS
ncbi:MAG TPA: glycosyltransferase [Acidobacteriaceae bacterium]